MPRSVSAAALHLQALQCCCLQLTPCNVVVKRSWLKGLQCCQIFAHGIDSSAAREKVLCVQAHAVYKICVGPHCSGMTRRGPGVPFHPTVQSAAARLGPEGPCMAVKGHADDLYLHARIQANRDAADECAQKAAQFAKVRVQTQLKGLSG